MKTYTAMVKNSEGQWVRITSEYNNKQEFMKDLKANDYHRFSVNTILVVKTK